MDSELTNNMTQGNIAKHLLRFFLPLLLSSFFLQLYNTVDAIILGRFIGKEALGAVGGSCAMIVQLFVGFFTGVASGANVIVANSFGAGDKEGIRKAVHTAIAFAFWGGLAFTILCILLAPALVDILQTPEALRGYSILYLRIYFIGLIPNFIYNMGAGILRAVGDSKRPLYVLVKGTFINIALDLLFVVVFHLGIAGAAIATILSLTINMIMILRILMREDSVCHLDIREIRIYRGTLRRIVHIGLPSGLEEIMYTISNLMIQKSINGLGTDTIAAWSAYGKIDVFFWMIIQSLGIAVATYSGQNYGAGMHKRIRDGVKTGLLISFILTGSLALFLMLVPRPLFHLFTTDEAVIEIGVQMLRYLARFYLIFIIIEILASTLRGMGNTLSPMLIVLFGTCILRIVWLIFAMPRWNNFYTVEASYPITWVVTSVILIIYFQSYMKKHIGYEDRVAPSHLAENGKQ